MALDQVRGFGIGQHDGVEPLPVPVEAQELDGDSMPGAPPPAGERAVTGSRARGHGTDAVP